MTKHEAGIYLAAMIEGEGHVSKRPFPRRGNKQPGYMVNISNTDLFILQRCAQALEILGVTFTLYGLKYVINEEKGKTSTRLVITSKKNFVTLWEWCGPWMVTHKRDSLRDLAFNTRSRTDPRPASQYDSRRGVKRPPEFCARMSEIAAGRQRQPGGKFK